MIRLGLIGSAGRMGQALKEYVTGLSDITLHAELEQGEAVADFIAEGPEVVVDLSLGAAVDQNAAALVQARLPLIVGATGYKSDTLARLAVLAERMGSPVLVVPNFSLGANLMIKCATAASRYMESASITERHHIGKVDAPSGTARFTAERIAKALAAAMLAGKNPAEERQAYKEAIPGVMGGDDRGVPVHSLRGAGYLAEQEVRFCLPGETLIIEHRSIDRRCFMSGIIYAIRNIGKVHGLQIGLDTILED